jgi:hypothetical protein
MNNVIMVDDFFSAESISAIQEGNYNVIHHSDERNAGITSRLKWEITCDPVDQELEDLIMNDGIRNQIKDWGDLSWRLVWNRLIQSKEINVSDYQRNGTGFHWHVDHWSRTRVLNWMTTIEQEDESFLDWCDEPFVEGEPFNPAYYKTLPMIPNRLVIMPSWYPHRVRIEHGARRLALHGHFNMGDY